MLKIISCHLLYKFVIFSPSNTFDIRQQICCLLHILQVLYFVVCTHWLDCDNTPIHNVSVLTLIYLLLYTANKKNLFKGKDVEHIVWKRIESACLYPHNAYILSIRFCGLFFFSICLRANIGQGICAKLASFTRHAFESTKKNEKNL